MHLQNSPSCKAETLSPLHQFLVPSPPTPGHPHPTSCLQETACLGASCEWNHTGFALGCLPFLSLGTVSSRLTSFFQMGAGHTFAQFSLKKIRVRPRPNSGLQLSVTCGGRGGHLQTGRYPLSGSLRRARSRGGVSYVLKSSSPPSGTH